MIKIIITFLVIFFFAQSHAFAQEGSLTVMPQLIQLDLSVDEPRAEFTYKNNTPHPVQLSLTIEDVRQLSEDGAPGFVRGAERENYKYGLSSWATLSNSNIFIRPGEERTVTVYVDKTRLTLGGYYASVLAEIVQDPNEEEVQLRGIFGSFLFVRSGSEYEVETGSILSFNPHSSFIEFPDIFIMRFQNTGNVDVRPYGLIEVYDVFGRKVARGIVNNGSFMVLPESIRQFNTPLERLVNFTPPGFYNAEISIHFGKNSLRRADSYAFFSQGDVDLKSLGGALLIIGAYMMISRWKRRK